jgi:predicted DNA-binding ribbon-helix-helix protein
MKKSKKEKQVQVRIPASFHKKLKVIAAKRGITISQLICEILF